MSFNFEKFVEANTPCYIDDSGNLIAVLGFGRVSDYSNATEEIWTVARVDKKGYIESIKEFKNAIDADNYMHKLGKENNWKFKEK